MNNPGVYRVMFDQTFVNTGGPTQKPWTVAASFPAQGAVLGAALLVPILQPGLLHPKIDPPIFIHLEPVHELARTEAPKTLSRSRSLTKAFVFPTKALARLLPQVDSNLSNYDPGLPGIVGAVPNSYERAGDNIFSDLLPMTKPVDQPKAAKQAAGQPAPLGPVTVSSGVQAVKLLFGPRPAYPPLARAARVQGTVRIQAIIGVDGTISSLQVMSGPPLLAAAARDAVSRWRYQPTLLSGRPVEVITEIDVNFTLGNQ